MRRRMEMAVSHPSNIPGLSSVRLAKKCTGVYPLLAHRAGAQEATAPTTKRFDLVVSYKFYNNVMFDAVVLSGIVYLLCVWYSYIYIPRYIRFLPGIFTSYTHITVAFGCYLVCFPSKKYICICIHFNKMAWIFIHQKKKVYIKVYSGNKSFG